MYSFMTADDAEEYPVSTRVPAWGCGRGIAERRKDRRHHLVQRGRPYTLIYTWSETRDVFRMICP